MTLLRFRSVRSLIPAAAATTLPMTKTLSFLSGTAFTTCVASAFGTITNPCAVAQRSSSSSFIRAAPASTTHLPWSKDTSRTNGGSRSLSAYGEGMDQEAMMESDYVIPVDKDDNPLLGRAISKRAAHAFAPSRPRGTCHRAFSVFLFNRRHELLLTQRASSKITFPNVWTNTCCSHPLEGMVPDEVDTNAAYPRFEGAKVAAVRKLGHELGIAADAVPRRDLVFLTRFHYWAADTVTYGADAPWGEHEIDYVFFVQCDEAPTLHVNEEEVGDHEYVSLARLQECMYDATKPLRDDGEEMRFSPWFRGIMERGGFAWMADLEGAYRGEYTNRDITYFDPPAEHYGSYNLASHGRDTGVLEVAKERVK